MVANAVNAEFCQEEPFPCTYSWAPLVLLGDYMQTTLICWECRGKALAIKGIVLHPCEAILCGQIIAMGMVILRQIRSEHGYEESVPESAEHAEVGTPCRGRNSSSMCISAYIVVGKLSRWFQMMPSVRSKKHLDSCCLRGMHSIMLSMDIKGLRPDEDVSLEVAQKLTKQLLRCLKLKIIFVDFMKATK